MKNNCVIQDWVQELTWKEQSSILTSIRGNDQSFDPRMRSLVRWIRRVTLHDADVNGVFVKHGDLPLIKDLKQILEYQSVHFVSHLMHTLEIIGYKAVDDTTRNTGVLYYSAICDMLHCNMETKEQMNKRLEDNREKT